LKISEDESEVQISDVNAKKNNFLYEILPIEYGGAFDSKNVV